MEERVSDCETMKRENRRLAAMSWGGEDAPPPKPSRVPQKDSSSMLTLVENSTAPQTYIIAQNPAVLAQLMRENENRPLNPSAYNTPATVFNTLGVHIDASKNEPRTDETPILPLKTVMLPASELLNLNPNRDDNLPINKSFVNKSTNPEQSVPLKSQIETELIGHATFQSQTHSNFPIPCEIINAKTQRTLSVDPMYKTLQASNICQIISYSAKLPPFNGDMIQKSRSLERKTSQDFTFASRISSLDRVQNSAQSRKPRSISLTRQLSSGNELSTYNYSGSGFIADSRSASLERGTSIGTLNYGFRNNSFECGYSHPMIEPSDYGNNKERNQSVGNIHSTPNSVEQKQQGTSFQRIIILNNYLCIIYSGFSKA